MKLSSPTVTNLSADFRPVPLRAGPVTLLFGYGDLRYLRIGGREIVRRIYYAVRDVNWDTIPFTLEDLTIDDQGDHFSINFIARHSQDNIQFDWEGEINGGSDGLIRYSSKGEAGSTFLRSRIGFCVLEPVSWAGAYCRIEAPDGTISHGHLPTNIAPLQPFLNIRALRRQFADDIAAEIRLEGDVYEMEDQRNWTDASFKIYSTPLSEPFPVELQPGTEVNQTIEVQVTGTQFAPVETPRPPSVILGNPTDLTVPKLGLGLPDSNKPFPDQVATMLKSLNLAHLRVDLDAALDDIMAKLSLAWQNAQSIDTQLEIALFLDAPSSPALPTQLTRIAEAVAQVQPSVIRWLIFSRTEAVTPPGLATAARETLAPLTPKADIGGGTNIYFTHINRTRPPISEFDCLAYSINPQVHADDDLSIIENLEAQPTTVNSASHFAAERPIVVSPITLRPRFNPDAASPPPTSDQAPQPIPSVRNNPHAIDVRQASYLAAAWMLGSLSHLSRADVHSLTYFETDGARGIMDETGHPYPLYSVPAALAAFAGATLLSVETSDALVVAALALRQGNHNRLLIANLTPEDQTIRIAGLEGDWRLSFLTEIDSIHPLEKDDGVAGVEFTAYAIACLDHITDSEQQ